MGYRKLGICKFLLFGSPDTADAQVEIEAKITDPDLPRLDILISRAWLLMLESQIGKVPKPIQDLTLDALSSQTLAYFQYGAVAPPKPKTPIMRHLATLEIELCFGKDMFVLAHPRDFDTHLRADGLVGLIMTSSFQAICRTLEGVERDGTLYSLIYGLHKWETSGRPGAMTAFTQTWDFSSLATMVERGRELIQQGWMTKLNKMASGKERAVSLPGKAIPTPPTISTGSDFPSNLIGRFAGCGAILIVVGTVGICLPLFGYQFRILSEASESLGLPEICASGLFVIGGLAIIVIAWLLRIKVR